ncbi:uncharacterized protein PRD47_019012 isoform 1-T1 [Ara ararauna]
MMMIPLPALSGLGRRIPLWNWASLVGRAGAGGSSWEANRMMDSGKRNADLGRLKEDPEESDTELGEWDWADGNSPGAEDGPIPVIPRHSRAFLKLPLGSLGLTWLCFSLLEECDTENGEFPPL